MVNNRITFGGVASGIDTNLIIDQLIAVQRRPISLMQTKQLQIRSRSDALGRVTTALSSLATRASTLNNVDTFRQRSASVLAKDADANKVAAQATTGAAAGAFTFHVLTLARETRVESAVAIGQPVDAGAPLDQAGLTGAFTPGTFTINGTTFTVPAATATTITSDAAIGAPFNIGVPLDAAGADITPAGGSFTINGVSINFSAEHDTLTNVINYINNSAAGVLASFDAATGHFTLAHRTPGSGQAITLSDDDGNFLEAMRLIDGGGGVIGVETAGQDLKSLNAVIGEINGAGIGVTASIVNDGAGRPNLLEITGGADVQLGSGGDTSNFLAVTSLLESPPGTTRTSQRGLGGVSRGADLQDARLDVPLTETTGSFRVNGVEITYDAGEESLANLISKINTSDAGVTVTYDAFTDRLKLTSDATGALAVTFEDVTGNFLAATGLLSATQTLGQNAAYSIDGGPTRYATSNTITDAVDGVTLTASDVTTEAVRVQVNLQPNQVVGAVEAFVTEFNRVLDTIDSLTVYREGGNSGVLFGDSTVRGIEQQLRGFLGRSIPGLPGGLRTPADIGLSFGAVGSGVGQTKHLVLDSTKLLEAARRDPEAVTALFTSFAAGAALTPGGTGAIESVTGTPSAATKTGRYAIASDGSGGLSVTFTPNDGSAASTTSGTITAGGTNTTLIPGLTLTARDPLQAGTDEIVINATREGFAKTLAEYVQGLTRSSGLLASRNSDLSRQISEIDRQIERLETRVEQREQQLLRKFTQMELAIARVQQQSQSLAQMQNQLGQINSGQR